MRRVVAALLVGALILSSCSLLGPHVWRVPPPTERPTASPGPTVSPSPSPPSSPKPGLVSLKVGRRDRTPDVPADDLRKLVRGNTAFALELYRRVRGSLGDNVVLGPYSISVAFGMQHVGTRGTSSRQIEDVLHFTLPTERLDQAFNALSLDLESRANPKLRFNVVNRLFGLQGYPFKEPFLREVTEQFGAPMAAVDFRTAPEQARKLINRWVASQTNRKIKELLGPGTIDRLTRLVLVNAIYLDAKWASPFLAAQTSDDDFRRVDGSVVKVPTMFKEYTGPVAVRRDYTAVELPYQGGTVAMLVVMPRRLKAFERSLDPAALDAIVSSLREEYVYLYQPKFSIRSNAELGPTLQAMGMVDPFALETADLSGISDEPLYISFVIHEAFIKVDEKGTEAAAATAIGDSAGSAGPDTTIRIDRPFLWFIRDRETGTVLFMGRVMDPSIAAD
jgi:serpin B